MVYTMLEKFGNVVETKMFNITGGSGLVEGVDWWRWAVWFIVGPHFPVQSLFCTLLRVIKQSPISLIRISFTGLPPALSSLLFPSKQLRGVSQSIVQKVGSVYYRIRQSERGQCQKGSRSHFRQSLDYFESLQSKQLFLKVCCLPRQLLSPFGLTLKRNVQWNIFVLYQNAFSCILIIQSLDQLYMSEHLNCLPCQISQQGLRYDSDLILLIRVLKGQCFFKQTSENERVLCSQCSSSLLIPSQLSNSVATNTSYILLLFLCFLLQDGKDQMNYDP